ncbi:MAG TPA: SRPBCC family protein [Vicinamibacterales bacterium]|nr:SRPBCC family protein [Vicinamibacterales bacterium]
MTKPRSFDVQAIEIHAPAAAVFEFVRNPRNLPQWAEAFQSADEERARLATPAGIAEIGLCTMAAPGAGTVDWRLEFPDGSVGLAHSRVTETNRGTCIYSFVLHAPPVPLEQLEGALDAQRATLQRELATLKSVMER